MIKKDKDKEEDKVIETDLKFSNTNLILKINSKISVKCQLKNLKRC